MYTKNEPEVMLLTAINASVFSVLVTFKPAQNVKVIRKIPSVSDCHGLTPADN